MNEEVLKLLKNDFILYFRVGLNECYMLCNVLKLLNKWHTISNTFIVLCI